MVFPMGFPMIATFSHGFSYGKTSYDQGLVHIPLALTPGACDMKVGDLDGREHTFSSRGRDAMGCHGEVHVQ